MRASRTPIRGTSSDSVAGTHRPLAIAPAARRAHGESLAVAATAIAIAMVPLLVPAWPANLAPEDLWVGFAILAALLWAGATGHRIRGPYALAMGLMLAGGAIGAMIGPVPGNGAVALVQDAWLLAWCWAIVNVCHSERNFSIVVSAWAYSAMVWVTLLFVGLSTGTPWLTGQVSHQGARTQLTLDDPSYAANYFFISLMIIWATGRPRHRGVRALAYALLVAGIATTGSNSGIVSLAVGVCTAGIITINKRSGTTAAVAAASLLLLVAGTATTQVNLGALQDRASASNIAFLRDGIGRGTSVGQRGMLLDESLALYREGSVLGEGPVSTKARLSQELAPFDKEAHNDYFAALIERGVVGFAGILVLVASLGARATLVLRRGALGDFAASLPYPHALVGAIAGTLVAGTVYELLHVRHVWALFGLLAAVCLRARE